MKDKHNDKLLSPAEVAKRLGVSPITVRSWVNKGWLNSHLTLGGHRRFLWEEVQRVMSERMGKPADDAPRILLVDDDPQFRSYLRDALVVLLPGADVREAIDGFEAGLAVAAFRPHLVLLDYAMPGISGATVCRTIKSTPDYAGTRVIAITGLADPDVRQTLEAAGADQVLFKPLDLKTIETILNQFALRDLA